MPYSAQADWILNALHDSIVNVVLQIALQTQVHIIEPLPWFLNLFFYQLIDFYFFHLVDETIRQQSKG